MDAAGRQGQGHQLVAPEGRWAMRICLVSQEDPPETNWGGIGTQTRIKARALVRAGHEVHVLSRAADRGPAMRTEMDEGVVVHRMQPPGFDFPIFGKATYMVGYSWTVLGGLNRLRKDVAFDVIDFPEYGGEGFAFLTDRKPWNWVPVVVELHGPMAMFTEYFGWPERGGRLHQVGTFLEAFSVRHADGLIACSAAVADLASRAYGVSQEG